MKGPGTAEPFSFRISKWIPSRHFRKSQVADIGTETHPDAGSDWCHNHRPAFQQRQTDASNEISGAVYPSEVAIKRSRIIHLVNKEECPRSGGAEVCAERGAMPIDFSDAGLRAHVERALTEAQASEKRAAALGPEHVSRWPPRLLERVLYDACEVCRNSSEEAARCIADFINRV